MIVENIPHLTPEQKTTGKVVRKHDFYGEDVPAYEERDDVTLDELELNPPDYPFELIDGKVVRKDAFCDEDEPAYEERNDVTLDELELNPPDYSFELIDGKVIRKMSTFDHGELILEIGVQLKSYLKSNPIGRAASDANYRLNPDSSRESRAPDISFIRTERLPTDTHTYPTIAPDLAVEIISPHDKANAVFDKARFYIDCGAQEVWLVLPTAKQILVYNADGIHSAREILTTSLLPGFELKLRELFG